MIKLLIHDPNYVERAFKGTKFGGRPSAALDSFEWPICRTCQGSMQFLGQVYMPETGVFPEALLLLFMCQNQPGRCDEWQAGEGAIE